MKKLSTLSTVLGSLLFISVCVGLMTAPPTIAQGRPGEKDVRVVNSPAEAVPVNVNQLPAVQLQGTPNVSVSNTPSVNVNSLPAVQVGNGAGNPVPVSVTNLPGAQSSGEPWMQNGVETLGSGVSERFRLFTQVPAGKRLVIEYVSFKTSDFTPGVRHYLELQAGVRGSCYVVADGTVGHAQIASKDVSLTAEPNESIGIGFARDTAGGESYVHYTVVGRLIDVP